MRLNRKHKAYGGILALGLGLLIVDRVTSKPPTASAEPLPEELAILPETATATDQSPSSGPAGGLSVGAARLALAQKLSSAAESRAVDPQSVPDAFTPKWTVVNESPAVTAQPVGRTPAQFASDHQLSAVMGAGTTGTAIVDGRAIRIGDQVDGYRLVFIKERTATFESNGQSVILEVPLDGKVKQLLDGAASAATGPSSLVADGSNSNGR